MEIIPMNKMKLGILYKDNKAVNHRSLVKVLLNPILRKFGIQIATNYNEETDTFRFG